MTDSKSDAASDSPSDPQDVDGFDEPIEDEPIEDEPIDDEPIDDEAAAEPGPTTRRRLGRRSAGATAASAGDEPAGAVATKTDRSATVRSGRSSSTPSRTDDDGIWIVRLVRYVARYLREIVAELRKVIWPSRHELITYTVVVVIFVVILVSIVAALDFGFARGTLFIFG